MGEMHNRNPLGDDDLTIQVTWETGEDRALVTVRAKDQDLNQAQLRAFARALLCAARDLRKPRRSRG